MRVAYAECNLNRELAELLKTTFKKKYKVEHDEHMNLDRLVDRMKELDMKIAKGGAPSGLYAFFPDMEKDIVKAKELSEAVERIKRRLERRGARCKEKEDELVKVVCCKKRKLEVLIVMLKGGMDDALARLAGVSEGESQRRRRDLKRGRTPGKFRGSLEALAEHVAEALRRLGCA
ncbi:MAG: hypothetical protein GXO07_03800 [Crenarchaeota archaeon]|nr:hypothetical protein [Thermoproteota archaeon]